MAERFDSLTNQIVNKFPPCKLNIAELGDSVHGLIHGSVRKYSEDVITSVHAVTECLAKMIATL